MTNNPQRHMRRKRPSLSPPALCEFGAAALVFTIGYRYQHISNGYRAPLNPGVDVQMIYAGFSVFK